MDNDLIIQQETEEETLTAEKTDDVGAECAETAKKPAKKRGKRLLVALFSLVLIAALGFVGVRWGVPAFRYLQAGSKFSHGNYAAAEEIYESLGGYRDSEAKLEETKKMIKYTRAQKFYEEEEFQKAYWDYSSLGDFLDAEERAEDAERMHEVKTAYETAKTDLFLGQLRMACELLVKIEDENYKDTAEVLESAKKAVYERAVRHAGTGELRTAKWYFEYLEEIGYESAAETWKDIREEQKLTPDDSYYDLSFTPITGFGPKTTEDEFATVFLQMFTEGKKKLSLSVRGFRVSDVEEFSDRLWEGNDIASECLPEYSSVYQDCWSTYWYDNGIVYKDEIICQKNGKYTVEEMAAHMERIKTFCEESVLELTEAGLLGSSMSSRQKAKIIYDWVAYYLTYDDTKELHNTGVAIEEKLGVCECYVSIYNRMCNLVGIPSYGQLGDTNGDEEGRHVWSVQLDENGEIFYTDATWGDKIYFNFTNSEEQPSVEDFYKRFYADNMNELLTLSEEDGTYVDGARYFSPMTKVQYFWQKKLWDSHVPERPAEEIIDCPFHNNG